MPSAVFCNKVGFIIAFVLWHNIALGAAGAGSMIVPELPRVSLSTTYVQSPKQPIFLGAGKDLQAALNAAKPGDVISLQAGATFVGNFTLPNKRGKDWIVIRSSASDASLPTPGTRVKPSDAHLMAKIVSPNTDPALRTDAAANHYRLIGVEITTKHSTTASTHTNLVLLGGGGETAVGQLPSDIVFDRCYIHGTPTGNVRRGVALNGARLAVIDSHLSDFHEIGQDSQAIMGWNGPGPFKIANNYLEAAGENIMFGGATTSNPTLIPSDIEIRGNHFHKPLSWRIKDRAYAGAHWMVKNLLELKIGQRVLVQNNLFENSWEDAQSGFAILFTPRNADGNAPWTVVQDITFRRNVIRHAGSGVNISGREDSGAGSAQTKRILIEGNLFQDIRAKKWGGQNGHLFQLSHGTADVVIDHNTGFQDGAVVFVPAGGPHTGFKFQNNVAPHNRDGISGDGAAPGHPAIQRYFPGAVIQNNVLSGGDATRYPAGNFFPAGLDDAGLADGAAADYRIADSSPAKKTGPDGKAVGAEAGALLEAMRALSGGSK